ncbi:MAG: hypothetical protein ACLFVJ_12750 [Persicimonas sp.]
MKALVVFASIMLAVVLAFGVGCDRDAEEFEDKQRASEQAKDDSPQDDSPQDDSPQDEHAEILEDLEDEKASEDERLDAIHRAREARLEGAASGLRALLESDSPDIVVASAAALERIDGEEAGPAVVAAAERLSRTRQYEHLRQLLYILADIGGRQATTYLRAVADGHEYPGLRQVATGILERQ